MATAPDPSGVRRCLAVLRALRHVAESRGGADVDLGRGYSLCDYRGTADGVSFTLLEPVGTLHVVGAEVPEPISYRAARVSLTGGTAEVEMYDE